MKTVRTIICMLMLAGAITVTLARPASAYKYLSAPEVQAQLLLPPPPADSSKETTWSYQELLHLQQTRTAKELAQAKADSDTRSVRMFAGVLGPKFDLAALPKTRRLFQAVRKEEKAAVRSAKAYFHRTRPWALHPDLKNCHRGHNAYNSYPSGHTTMAYSMGIILARLIPEKAQALLARSANYAEGRLICGQHYRRDIAAGQAFGTHIAMKLMENPDFAARLRAVKAELVAAGLTK